MDCDWIFINQDHSRQEVTLPESKLPQLGDGKDHDDKGYEVVVVITDRVTRKESYGRCGRVRVEVLNYTRKDG